MTAGTPGLICKQEDPAIQRIWAWRAVGGIGRLDLHCDFGGSVNCHGKIGRRPVESVVYGQKGSGRQGRCLYSGCHPQRYDNRGDNC